MRDPMMKRIPRALKRDIGKYIALFLFLTLVIGFISGFIVGDESLKARYDTSFSEFNIEDGHFVLEKKASPRLVKKVENVGVKLYPLFYKEETIEGKGPCDGDTIRVYEMRTKVNLSALWEGRDPDKTDEIAVDRLYAENNGIEIGDTIRVAGKKFAVTGFTSLSDYSSLFRSNADTMFDATDFTVATVTEEGFDRIRARNLKYCYVWKDKEKIDTEKKRHDREEEVKNALIDAVMEDTVIDPDMAGMYSAITENIDDTIASFGSGSKAEDDDDSLMENMLVSLNGIVDFVGRTSNQAINFTGDDMGKDRVMMVTLLYIVIVIMAFVFGVTVKSTIEKEAKAIGTLRASGYSREEMLKHYIALPMIVTLAAALTGNVIGYTAMKGVCASMYLHSYSLLPYRTLWSFNAFRDTTLVPLVIIFIVVFVVISKELRLTPLEFLHEELSSRKKVRAVKLSGGSFMSRYRKRVLLQNRGSYIIIFVGIFFSVIVMFFCLGMRPLLDNYKEVVEGSGMAEYQYILKEPCSVKAEDAEKYQVAALKNADERAEEITLYGIKDKSRYLSDVHVTGSANEAVISSAYAEKYMIGVGDVIRLKEEYKKKVYEFRVADIYDYELQLAAFVDIDSFNKVFDLGRNEYAGYLSDTKLEEIPQDKVATVITREDYATISKQLDSSMGSLFEMFTFFGIVIFIIVIYLLSKVMIEKNSRSIAMSKILGYSDQEISSIYNRVTTIVVLCSLLVSLVLGYFAFKGLFRVMMMFFTGWLTYYIAPLVYVKIVLIGMAGYLFVHMLQMRRIRKVPMGEVLKGME